MNITQLGPPEAHLLLEEADTDSDEVVRIEGECTHLYLRHIPYICTSKTFI